MRKYKVRLDYPDGSTEILDEVFDDRESAEWHGQEMCNCYLQGIEIIGMSDPGDLPGGDPEDIDFTVFDICL